MNYQEAYSSECSEVLAKQGLIKGFNHPFKRNAAVQVIESHLDNIAAEKAALRSEKIKTAKLCCFFSCPMPEGYAKPDTIMHADIYDSNRGAQPTPEANKRLP